MAKSTAIRQLQVSNDASRAMFALLPNQVRYLATVRMLLDDYRRTGGSEQRQIFARMMHAFMQELCGYPPTSYIVTTAAYGSADAGSYPHVVPGSYIADPTLFYFTASEDPDDVHDLWVKHAQVYLIDASQGDVAAERAMHVVFSNFFVIDGASKDCQTGVWDLWPAVDAMAQIARVDLRNLENATALEPTASHGIQKRLQTLQYQAPPDIRQPGVYEPAALAEPMSRARMEGQS